jgi:hypothetical protein
MCTRILDMLPDDRLIPNIDYRTRVCDMLPDDFGELGMVVENVPKEEVRELACIRGVSVQL